MGAEREELPLPAGGDLVDARLREEIELLTRVIDLVADYPTHLTTWQIDALLDVGRPHDLPERRRRRRRRDA
ncbi:hypothetical protein [Terrabacter sp. MAHUQ-38]|jgi:hypothetical protein|uniref:hypothetical protein n=1 Tax=unclassified Terrabacter TaxID=2630222 RepID=UPI00165DDF1B|nr:hypothetical protein [Terrabacter sp. MAHUQ-38]MBC9821015.1 hypothetical protein [Terrabacter sp. MAHUQ-38]